MNWKQHLPLGIATAAVVLTLALGAWSIDRHIDAADTSRFELEQIDGRLADMQTHIEAIDVSTCSMDKHVMSAGEALADVARKC